MIKYLQDDNFEEEIKKDLLLVDFYADWCGPCKAMGEVLEKVDAEILKVNVDEYPKIAATYGVMSIPTLILFKNGSECAKNIGYLSLDELNQFIGQYK